MAISHTPLTPEVPRSSKQSRRPLEWASTTMKEIYSISIFHKTVICRIQFQLPAAVGTKLEDIAVTMPALPPAATAFSDLRFQRRSHCASCFKPPPTCFFSYSLYNAVFPLLVLIQQFLRSHCKKETLNSLGFGEVNAIKFLFHMGLEWRAEDRTPQASYNDQPGTLWNHACI